MGHAPDSGTSLTLLNVLCGQEQDEAAWRVFCQRYQPMIRGWCVRQRLQAADAEDVIGLGVRREPPLELRTPRPADSRSTAGTRHTIHRSLDDPWARDTSRHYRRRYPKDTRTDCAADATALDGAKHGP